MIETFFIVSISLARVIVGGLFLFAGYAKLRMGESRFLSDLLAYDLLPVWMAQNVSTALPIIEMEVGVFLIFGFLTSIVACVGCLMLLTFSMAILVALFRGKDISCGCFGRQDNIQQKRYVIIGRNVAMFVLLVIVFLETHKAFALDNIFPLASKGSWWLGMLGMAFGVVVIYLLMKWLLARKFFLNSYRRI